MKSNQTTKEEKTQRTYILETTKNIGKEATIKGWVYSVRSHGQLIFIDLRDSTGIVQTVIAKDESPEAFEEAKKVADEYVVEITGSVKKRDEKYINKEMPTGEVEISVTDFKILAKSKPLPFPIHEKSEDITELLRLKYRYLDLRNKKIQDTIKMRGELIRETIDFLSDLGFTYIETPILTKATPEGARDFVVPSRYFAGKFYALPQSPQQYKQLLMIAGFEKYFQIARCFRDEDPRADRGLEFTQIDLEMCFPTQEEIQKIAESLMKHLFKNVVQKYHPKKKLVLLDKNGNFPRIKRDDSVKQYNSDRPDLRIGTEYENDPDAYAFAWIIDFPMFTYKEGDKRWGAEHHPFTAMYPEDIEKFRAKKFGEVRAMQYDIACNGYEVAGGSIRNTDKDLLMEVFEALGHEKKEILEKFGHLLEAFEFGVPPHGGIAIGMDRNIMNFTNTDAIREVIAFPTTQSGLISVMDGPSELDEKQLKELCITVDKEALRKRK